jgi:hypothetical protein
MLILLKYKCAPDQALDYQLIDILRSLSTYDRDAVISRFWLVASLELYTYEKGAYGQKAIELLFPEIPTANKTDALVLGQRLLERSALVHQFESGLFLRVIDPAKQVRLYPDLQLSNGPTHYQATNVDLEIRCGEAGPYEIITDDKALIDFIQYQYKGTEIRG